MPLAFSFADAFHVLRSNACINIHYFLGITCSDGYTNILGGCFYLHTTVMSQTDASSYCSSHVTGAYLATLDSQSQWEAVLAYLEDEYVQDSKFNYNYLKL